MAVIRGSAEERSSSTDQSPEHVRQDNRERFRLLQYSIVPRAKHPGKILGRVPVDGNAERMNGLEAGFGHGLTHIFHAVATLVVIDIIRFSVRQQDKQAIPGAGGSEQAGGMANRSSRTRVELRFQCCNAALDKYPVVLFKILQRP